MDNILTLGTVHVVEWLRPGDVRTGWDLFGELEPLGIASKPEVQTRFWRAVTREGFTKLLQTFENEFRATGRIPLLHVETHGNSDGIGVSADEGIRWPDFMEALISFNRLTRLNLVVVLAACEGFWGVQMLQPDRRAAAFRGLIGPNRRVDYDELSRGCMAFYRTVFGQLNGDAALKAMNGAVDPAKDTFWSISAETAFKIVYQSYLENQCTPEAFENRVATILENIGERRRAEGHVGRFKWEIARDREVARTYLGDHRARFEEMRREFFFIDLYPENGERFDVTMEDCRPRPTPPAEGPTR